MIKVIALDPGVTTGYAIGVINQGLMECKSDQEKLEHLAFYNLLRLHHPDYVVCEAFDFRKSSDGANLFPRELIGVTNYYVQKEKSKNNKIELHMQKPAEAKGAFADKHLKEANLHTPGRPHANDAMRHLLQWYVFKQGYQFNTRGFTTWKDDA